MFNFLRSLACAFSAALLLASAAHAQIASTAQDWADAERYANATPIAVERTPQELGRYLGEASPTAAGKLRAIYKWMAIRMNYDTASYRAGRQNHQTPQQALDSRLSTCEGFSYLFADLAQFAGVPVSTAVGYVKDSLHQTGQNFSETNHAWNLIQLEGKWWLIDSTWGTGYDDGTKFIRRFDPYYFLAPPDELALTHFARDEKLRVGQPARDLKEFGTFPFAPVTLLAIAKPAQTDIQRAKTEGFVRTFDLPIGALRLVKAPLTLQLLAAEAVRFEIESGFYEQFAVLQNGVWTDFKRAAPEQPFTVVYTPPAAGPVQIAARRKQDRDFTIVLEYTAK